MNIYIIFILGFIALSISILIPSITNIKIWTKNRLLKLSRENKRILFLLSNHKDSVKIDDIYKNKNRDITDESISWLVNEGYIINRKGNFSLSSSGKKRFFEKYSDITKNNESMRISTTNILISLMMIFIAFGSFQLQSLQTQILESTSQSPYPEIDLKLIDGQHERIHYISEIQGLTIENNDLNFENNSKFYGKHNEIGLLVANYGKSPAGNIHFQTIDNNTGLTTNVDTVNIGTQESKFAYIRIKDKNCWGSFGEDEYKASFEDCFGSNLEPGIKEVILKVDCDTCINMDNPTCYSFSICLTNYSLEANNFCENLFPKENFKLNLIDCPK